MERPSADEGREDDIGMLVRPSRESARAGSVVLTREAGTMESFEHNFTGSSVGEVSEMECPRNGPLSVGERGCERPSPCLSSGIERPSPPGDHFRSAAVWVGIERPRPRPDRPRAEAYRARSLAARGATSKGSRSVGLPADVRPTGSQPVEPYVTCTREG